MGLLRDLFSKSPTPRAKPGTKKQATDRGILGRAKEQGATASLHDDAVMSKVMMESSLQPAKAEVEAVKEVKAVKEDEPKSAGPSEVNIWDLAGDDSNTSDLPKPAQPAEAVGTASARRPRRKARNKTRILGFTPQDTTVNTLFEGTANADTAVVKNMTSMNPTGWLVVVSGAGRGASFPLFTGMASIGRAADQMIALDFGDTAISRENHASIAYDPTEHVFYFGHGGKSNLVRMNGKPVLSTELAKDGDEFLIGETTLRLKTFCGPDFNWESNTEGDDHVAIA